MNKNLSLFEQSQTLIPGGVNSPVRAFGSVGGTPIFFKKGLGSRLWDENDKEYIDYINSWGPMILGHANQKFWTQLSKHPKIAYLLGHLPLVSWLSLKK
jgi:glutamate-1-semialdehyde 2,1-aminomutase